MPRNNHSFGNQLQSHNDVIPSKQEEDRDSTPEPRLISILDAILVVLEEARNATLGAQIVVHEHFDVAMDGALSAHSAQIGVATHATDDALLVAVAHAVGIVIAAEAVRRGGTGRGQIGRNLGSASRTSFRGHRAGSTTGSVAGGRRVKDLGFIAVGKLARRAGRLGGRRCLGAEKLQLATQQSHGRIVVVVAGVVASSTTSTESARRRQPVLQLLRERGETATASNRHVEGLWMVSITFFGKISVYTAFFLFFG